jgi:hypothetical protein
MNPLKNPVKNLASMNYTLLRDGMIVASCLLGSGIVLIMGGANCYVNLINSGAFEGMEWVAFTLSCLPAIGSFSIKFFSNLISDRYKNPYAIVINGLSIVSLLAWSIFFALSFSNNTPINLDSMGQESNSHNFAIPYTLSQILAELFCAATLFLVADESVAKYIRESKTDNPDYIKLEQTYAHQAEIHHKLLSQRNEKLGLLKKYEALKKAYITEQVTSYFNIASQLKP